MLQISAKNLGAVALEEFCPRCFWFKLKTGNRLPWQIFPGIFSSIDAYTKRVVHAQIDAGESPAWMKEIGAVKEYRKVPHFSKSKLEIPEYDILLTGAPDDIFLTESGGHVIPDYKTAKFTTNQDKLLPMYVVQLNGYAMIMEAMKFSPVSGLFVVYFEPMTDEESANKRRSESGFSMEFSAHPVAVQIDRSVVDATMKTAADINGLDRPPAGRDGCKDCQAVDAIIQLAA